MHKFYDENTKGRDFVVGDIHGMYDLFIAKLKEIDFNYSTDRMFSVGDLVDRGPDNMACLSLIKEDWFHAVRGNHEDMMIKGLIDKDKSWFANWISNGGIWYYEEDPDEVMELVLLASELPLSITVVDIGICHAQPPTNDWQDVQEPSDGINKELMQEYMIWGRDHIYDLTMPDTKNIKQTIHGHTPVEIAKIVGNAYFIDTGAFYKNELTVIELNT